MVNLVGKKAPNFKLNSTSGKIVELSKIKSNYIVLYFYPKDDTPGCTLETKDFNSLLSSFKKAKCEVYGISKDNINSHKKFKEKYKIKFELLSDEEKKPLNLIKHGVKKSLWEENSWVKLEVLF